MQTASRRSGPDLTLSSDLDLRRPFRPVAVWAVVGGLFLAVQGWAYGNWILSGPTRTPPGPTSIPTWMNVGHWIFQIGGPLAALTVLWFFLVRPWRRTGHLTLDGMFCLAFALCYWQDMLLDYFQPVYVYNAHLFNLGAWNLHIPGWVSPQGDLVAEPLLAIGPMYVYAVFGSVILSNYCMRKARARWPRLGNVGLLAGTFACFFVFDMIVETPMLATGLFSFPGAIRGITLFDGNYYQFPLSEAFFMSCIWTAWSAVRFFRDDKGRTIAERGVDDLRVSERSRTGIRFLAVVGITNAVLLVLYMIPVAILGLYAGQWPDDVKNRSYFVTGQCGPGTTYACPAPGVPIARRDSARLGPDGQLVPKDTPSSGSTR